MFLEATLKLYVVPGVRLIARYVLTAIFCSNKTKPLAGTPASQNKL